MVTVLVVDDDPDARTVYRDALESSGYRVLTARHGAEGVDTARRQRPDLVLLDIRMPVMDGLDALRYLKSYASTARIPVWGISAYFEELKEEKGLLERFDYLLRKPLAPEQLVTEVDFFFGPRRLSDRDV